MAVLFSIYMCYWVFPVQIFGDTLSALAKPCLKVVLDVTEILKGSPIHSAAVITNNAQTQSI